MTMSWSPKRSDPAWQGLGRANDLAGLNAGGAHIEALGGTTYQSANTLNVGVPATLGAAMRVGHVMPETGALSADIAVCSHCSSSGVKARTYRYRQVGSCG